MNRPVLALAFLLSACGPPNFVKSVEQIDDFLARGNYAYACVGLRMTDEHVKRYTTEKLVKYPEEAEAVSCLCDAVYDAEAGSWDPVVAKALHHSRSDDVAACLAKAVDDERVEDRPDLLAVLGNMLAPSGFVALERVAKQDPDPALRGGAIRGLQASPEHGAFLISMLEKDSAPAVRSAAARALSGRKEKERRGALTSALKSDKDASVRLAAVEVLTELQNSEVEGAICDAMMGDEDSGVRSAAAKAFHASKSKYAIGCLRKRMLEKEEDGTVRETVLESLKSSPREEAAKALCEGIGPVLRMYVKDKLVMDIPGAEVVGAQNDRDWERSFECVRKAMAQGGYSCYARNYLAHWTNDLGGKANPPWCPGMPR